MEHPEDQQAGRLIQTRLSPDRRHHLFVKKEKKEPRNNIVCKIDSKNILW
jgi:hypothetical protein